MSDCFVLASAYFGVGLVWSKRLIRFYWRVFNCLIQFPTFATNKRGYSDGILIG
jgi:hypothetical protein